MTPELILLVVGALGASGAGGWWWRRRAGRDHVIRTRTGWVRAGTIIRYGPVSAVCLGHRPPARTNGVVGVLGMTDRALVFDGQRARDLDRDITLTSIRQVELCRVPIRLARGMAGRGRPVLHVHHADTDGHWYVSMFAVSDPVALALALERYSAMPVLDCGGASAAYGPADAVRLSAGEAGDWLAERAGDLYLAPGVLVFNWTEAIPLEQIAYVDVLGGGRPVLRIELAAGGVVGFEVNDPGGWGDAIRAQGDVPVARHGG